MVSFFFFIVLMAHIAAWLAMGGTWRAAYMAPFAVALPAVCLVLMHSVAFHGYLTLPSVLGEIIYFELGLLFLIACAHIAAPQSRGAVDEAEAA